MTIAEFEEISLILGIGGLVLFMIFILYKLAEESKAGKFGTLIIFFSLGLGFVGFAAKYIIKRFLES